MAPATSRCRSCGAPIRWATTAGGKSMPVDAEPTKNGNVVIDGNGRARVTAAGLGTHTSHFATCPDADTHRKAGS